MARMPRWNKSRCSSKHDVAQLLRLGILIIVALVGCEQEVYCFQLPYSIKRTATTTRITATSSPPADNNNNNNNNNNNPFPVASLEKKKNAPLDEEGHDGEVFESVATEVSGGESMMKEEKEEWKLNSAVWDENKCKTILVVSDDMKVENDYMVLSDGVAKEDEDAEWDGLTTTTTISATAISREKATMLALCWTVAMLSALDRVAMSVALLPMGEEMGYTDTMKGSLSSLFSVGYGLGIIPAGILVACTSPRTVMAWGVAWWSAATIATPWAAGSTMTTLLVTRATVGAAESVVLPTLQRLLSQWTTSKQKSFALAVIYSGFQSGTILAYLLSPWVLDQLDDWRGLFYLYGAFGFLWLVPWLLFAQDSPNSRTTAVSPLIDSSVSITAATVPAATTSEEPLTKTPKSITARTEESIATKNLFSNAGWEQTIQSFKSAPWKEFATSKGAWAMLLAHAANNWGLYNSLSWSPTFYAEQYGMNVRDSAFLSILPSIAGVIGGIIAGTSADYLVNKFVQQQDREEDGDNTNEEKDNVTATAKKQQQQQQQQEQTLTNIRKLYQGIALYGPAISLFTLSMHVPDQPWVAQLLLTGTTGLQSFNAAGYGAANQEKAGEQWSGLLYSITSLPAVLVGTTGVYITGRILDTTQQDWSYVFGLNAIICVLGATAFVTLYDSKQEFD